MHAMPDDISLDHIDRLLINYLQDGLPICDKPYAHVSDELGLNEETVIERIASLLERKLLSRFGPMFHAEKMGGGLALAAMSITEDDFDRIADIVNSFDEIAHNYQRSHRFNMWFVIATEFPEGIQSVSDQIEALSGYPVYCMPKKEEFYVGLRFEV